MEVTMDKKKAVWTVMVYLAGDNNLTPECLFALTEMKKADPGEYINVLAQFDPRDDYLPTQRYRINRSGPDGSLLDDIIDRARFNREKGEVRFERESKNAELLAESRLRNRNTIKKVLVGSDLSPASFEEEPVTDDTDTGSPITLYNFLSFCIQEYPADHYMVVLSGHSGGTESDYLLKDESSKGSLTFNELKQVFVQLQTDLAGRPVDIVGMDNCLMSMGEVCYEFRDLAQIVVGCESYSPAAGWPYRQILQGLKACIASPAKHTEVQVQVAGTIVEEYVNYYSPYWVAGMSVSQSALDVRRVGELREHVDRFAATVERELKKEHTDSKNGASPFKDALILAHWEAQSYNGEWFVDLFDFCDCLEKRSYSTAVSKQCAELKRFMAEEFVIRSCYSGAAYQYSNGVSMYFPWSDVSSQYRNLGFVKDSRDGGWLQFLDTYTQLTRRPPRGLNAIKAASSGQTTEAETEADARMADVRMADVRMADVRMADVRMADVRMADVRMADVRMADVRMADVRMADVRMADVRMADVRMMASEGKNPIHSMRNPPVVFFPTRCIAEHESVMKSLRKLFASAADEK